MFVLMLVYIVYKLFCVIPIYVCMCVVGSIRLSFVFLVYGLWSDTNKYVML